MTFEYHECANIFPMMEYAEHQQMCEDIRENGLRETIKMFEGKIIDGRNRYKACLEVGVSPRTETVETNDPVSYVVSLNLHRRHLNAGQRALVAASAIDVFRKRKSDRLLNLKKGEKQQKSNDFPEEPKLAHRENSVRSREDAANAFSVSHGYLGAAIAVKKRAIPEVQQAVLSGSIKLSKAEEISKLPQIDQKSTLDQTMQHKPKERVFDNRTLQQKKEGLPIIKNPASSAIQFAKLAIGQLSRIQRRDKGRKEAFQLVINWIKTHE